ncbi:G protein-coupled receptor 132 [Homo sapiens]|uniref:G protein-coupled receptor 132 n=1 Tax=Homo sapiens TaxID=9606 RepID=F8VRH8_HUMAN|nr:G protein-coupled receptor 132 [Homo sapiens]KAI4062708.1 G protein-coupled receptor 132 [Homo sapiens]
MCPMLLKNGYNGAEARSVCGFLLTWRWDSMICNHRRPRSMNSARVGSQDTGAGGAGRAWGSHTTAHPA